MATAKKAPETYAEHVRLAADLYDVAEVLNKIRWENGAAFDLHRATFDRTQQAMADIGVKYSKTYYEVLSDVRTLSRL